MQLEEGQTETVLDLSDNRTPNGVYFVYIRAEGQLLTQRLVVTK